MASIFVTQSGATLIVPDSSVDVKVENNPSGIATSGVIAIVGEADSGPSWEQDKLNGRKLSLNSYGPTDVNRVMAKYGSGRIVDAFRGIATPSSSPRIQGSPNRIVIVKTNDSAKASKATDDNHGSFKAKREGADGNEIKFAVATTQSESAPTTGAFSYVPSASTSSVAFRVNGGAKATLNISADMAPDALANAITQGISALNAVGGVSRGVISGLSGQNIELSVVSGQDVEISLAAGQLFAATPVAGDTIRIASGSVIQGGSNENIGWYLVTSVSNTTTDASIQAKKITVGAPSAVAPIAISGSPAADMLCYSAMRIDNVTGTDRQIINTALVGTNLTVSVAGSAATLTLATGSVFAVTPKVGDLLKINAGPFQGAGNANIGWYQVTEVSNNIVSAYIKASRLSNGLPVAVAAAAIGGTSNVVVLDRQIKGVGKALEIYDNGGSANINTIFKDLAVNNAADFLGELLVSDAELKKQITLKKDSIGANEVFAVGGNVVLSVGYNGTTASLTISRSGSSYTLTTTVTGGAGANLNIDLNKIATISDLVSKINGNTGYSASAGSVADSQRNPSILDELTVNIASDLGHKPGRIKRDIYDLVEANVAVNNSSVLVEYIPVATAGLPTDMPFTFLENGAKGASTGLDFANAIDALQGVRCNFVVPLVSADAADDIALGETDAGSTYTVDAVNTAVKSHCLAMSTAKIKRHRIGVVSKRGSFQEAKESALNLANFRIAHLFQDVSDINANGDIEQFQPWMASVKAAGMQAAGAYKSIFNKTVNITKAVQAAGDFDDENLTDCEDAILAGLIPIQRQETGGYNFLTDQTTYGLDNNIVYNSVQAVYVSDLIALSLAESLKKAFVGESVADVTAAVAVSFIKAKMAEFLSLKFIVGTTDFPAGYKSINVSINGNVMEVEVVAILTTSIKFIPITLSIEGIKSTASA